MTPPSDQHEVSTRGSTRASCVEGARGDRAVLVVKVLTTGMGEAASDYLGGTSLVLGGLVGVGGFAIAVWLQLRSERYRAPVYWFCVSMIAVFGTMLADVLHVVSGLPLWATSSLYALAVAVMFVWWWRSEGDARHPQHHHRPSGALLLGHRPGHVRAGHSCG